MAAVKSLQMGADFGRKYGDLLTQYLVAGFSAKQVGNTYDVISNGLEQVMILVILIVGALLVIQNDGFAGRMSQPLLRLVGLWREFLQANIVVKRLGGILDMPQEPYALMLTRENQGVERIELQYLAFRYAEHQPAILPPTNFGTPSVPCRKKPCSVPAPSTTTRSWPIRMPASGMSPWPARRQRFLKSSKPSATATRQRLASAVPGSRVGNTSGVAIARALLKRPKILIFDEAVSNLDQYTAEHYARTINKLKGKVTMLFITHQIPRGLQVDRVIELGRTIT